MKLHDKYGPLVRIGPGEVSIGDYHLYRRIYSQNTCTKEESFYGASTLLGKDHLASIRYVSCLLNPVRPVSKGALSRNKALHSARRKMMSQPFSQQAINENESLITEMSERLAERIITSCAASPTGTSDVVDLCKLFSLEVICKAAFNRDISQPSMEHAMTFLRAMEDTPVVMIMLSVFPFLRDWTTVNERLPGLVGHAFRQSKHYEQFTRSLFRSFQQESKTDSTERFMGTPLIRGVDAHLDRQLSEDEAIEEAMGLAFAGSGTTSSTLLYLFYQLSRPQNRNIQLKLREELQQSGRKLIEVKDLPYLNAVIKETMRLHPTIISTLPRVLDVPLQCNDIVLPANTIVGMQNYVHHRDPKVYTDPHSFIPDRWIGQTQSSELEKAFTPFSLGSRNCIGQNLAKAELYIAASLIFRRFDLRLNEAMKETDMDPVDRFVLSPVSGKLLLDVSELH